MISLWETCQTKTLSLWETCLEIWRMNNFFTHLRINQHLYFLPLYKLVKIHGKMTFCFYGFQSKRLEVLYENFVFSINFISMNNNEHFVRNVTTLTKKKVFCILRVLFICLRYERKWFIKLKKYFKVSNTQDYYH
jgi:hypothetical protein